MKQPIIRAKIKEKSLNDLGGSLFGNTWLSAVVIVFIYQLISGFASGFSSGSNALNTIEDPNIKLILALVTIVVSAIGIILSFAIMPMAYGYTKNFMMLTRGQGTSPEKLFSGYKEGLGKNIALAFMTGLYTLLWSLLFIIPGIVKSYSYSMAFYILNDKPHYTWQQALDESKSLTDGYKMDLFLLDLSFIGWYIVGALCLGIGTLWVEAYHMAAKANFYNAISGYKPPVANPEQPVAPQAPASPFNSYEATNGATAEDAPTDDNVL